jgi:GTPase Era involved in 16S rRNA processing
VLTSAEWRTQLCFQDTPGVIEEPQYALQDTMMEAVRGSLTQCDVHLVVSDVFSVVP